MDTIVSAIPSTLPRYSAAEAQFFSHLSKLFPLWPEPDEWLKPIFADLFRRNEGSEICLTVKERGKEGERTRTFLETDITIGRDAASEIQLKSPLISKQHARIFFEDGAYYVIDTGSLQGTYLNGVRLTRPEPLNKGDLLVIFPYSFEVDVRARWVLEKEIDLQVRDFEPVEGEQFCRGYSCAFRLVLEPPDGEILVALQEDFLHDLLDRILGPYSDGRDPRELGPVDRGILKCLMAAILARVNAGTVFPYRLRLESFETSSKSPQGKGMGAVVSVGTKDVKGHGRIFFGGETLEDRCHSTPDVDAFVRRTHLDWALLCVKGRLSLSPQELASLEIGDILLYDDVPMLLMPGDLSGGWSLRYRSTQPWSFELDKYFERQFLMNEEMDSRKEQTNPGSVEADDGPDREAASSEEQSEIPQERLDELPVTLHLVLGEKRLTLQEISDLRAGSILELDSGMDEEVRLAANGRIIGRGRLVEVDDRLGVRISSWGCF